MFTPSHIKQRTFASLIALGKTLLQCHYVWTMGGRMLASELNQTYCLKLVTDNIQDRIMFLLENNSNQGDTLPRKTERNQLIAILTFNIEIGWRRHPYWSQTTVLFVAEHYCNWQMQLIGTTNPKFNIGSLAPK